jgi:hypothetical protein
MFVLRRLRIAFDRVPTFFEESEVARYVTLVGSAGGFTIPDPAAELPISDRHFQDIDAPGLITGSLPVIFFRTTHTGNPRFGVRLNATPLTQQTLSEAGPHAWHEIIPTGALKREDNELTFAVDGDGSVRFSDVVILYKSNQLTVRRPIPEPELAQT